MAATGGTAETRSDWRSVQDYIDETPAWSDGTPVAQAPMTTMQKRVWCLAAAGKFFEGLVVFTTGVALPLIADEFDMTAAQHGIVGAASLFGILIGALAFGGLADLFGRKFMFVAEMIVFSVFLVLLTFSPNFTWLVVFLVGVGLALGCDYPTAHLMISESVPSRIRGRLVLGAFAFQALGALIGTVIGYMILKNIPDITAWRYMYGVALLPALLVTIGRFFVPESAPWLFAQGRFEEAERQAMRLLERKPPYPKHIKLERHPERSGPAHAPSHYGALFTGDSRRATLLASLPWFLQDLGTYGIGIFTPTILAASVGHTVAVKRNIADIVNNDMLAAQGSAFIDGLLIVGIVFAVLLTDRLGRIPLQILGFIGCAAGLLLASFSAGYSGSTQTLLIFSGFMLFNFMTNLGPNAQTYLLAGEVFPTRLRGKGAGLAAAIAKVGAVTTAFLFPILLADIGTPDLLHILVCTSLLGAFLTWYFRIETTGVNLDHVGRADRKPAPAVAQPARSRP